MDVLPNCSYRKTGIQECQPDVSYYLGDRAQIIPQDTSIVDLDRFPPPDLIIEVAVTTLLDDRATNGHSTKSWARLNKSLERLMAAFLTRPEINFGANSRSPLKWTAPLTESSSEDFRFKPGNSFPGKQEGEIRRLE